MKFCIVALAAIFLSGCNLISKDTGAKVHAAATKACQSGTELESAWTIGKEAEIFTDQKLILKIDAAFAAFKVSCDSAKDLDDGVSITQLAILYIRLRPIIEDLKT